MTEIAPGNLFIVASPSGGGKTSLVRWLVSHVPHVAVSVSHTTRTKRPGEVDGVHYHFVEEQYFTAMVAGDAFVEYAKVFSNWYGTSKQEIQTRLAQGMDLLLAIDWQGALQIKRHFPQSVSVFILPPSLETLKHRLTERQQDHTEIINFRMQQAREEMTHYTEFDYLIINEEFAKAATELQAIVIANRLKTARQSLTERKLLSFLLSSQ